MAPAGAPPPPRGAAPGGRRGGDQKKHPFRRAPRPPRPPRPGGVPKLKLKWAFAFPGDLQSYSQATLAGGRLFVGSWGGKVYSLDASTGCVHWFFEAQRGVRAAISLGRIQTAAGPRDAAFIGDTGAN